jgi:hypothetical protein
MDDDDVDEVDNTTLAEVDADEATSVVLLSTTKVG